MEGYVLGKEFQRLLSHRVATRSGPWRVQHQWWRDKDIGTGSYHPHSHPFPSQSVGQDKWWCLTQLPGKSGNAGSMWLFAEQKWSRLLWLPFAPFFLPRKHTQPLPRGDNPKSWPDTAPDSKSRQCSGVSSWNWIWLFLIWRLMNKTYMFSPHTHTQKPQWNKDRKTPTETPIQKEEDPKPASSMGWGSSEALPADPVRPPLWELKSACLVPCCKPATSCPFSSLATIWGENWRTLPLWGLFSFWAYFQLWRSLMTQEVF